MKKSIKYLVAFATLFATPLTMTACGGVPAEVVEKLETVLDNIENIPTTATADFKLPVTGIGGTAITWTSSNTAVIAIDGVNARVTRPQEADVTVTLTATATVDGYSDSKPFAVLVTKVTYGEYITVAEAYNSAIGTDVTVRGVVSELVYQTANTFFGFYITDSTRSMYVYGGDAAATLKKGDEIIFTAERAENNGCQQLAWPDVSSIVKVASNVAPARDAVIEGETIPTISDKVKAGEDLSCNVYKLNCRIEVYQNASKGYANYEIIDSDGKYINLYTGVSGMEHPEFAHLDAYKTDYVDMAFIVQGKTNSGYPRGTVLWIYE